MNVNVHVGKYFSRQTKLWCTSKHKQGLKNTRRGLQQTPGTVGTFCPFGLTCQNNKVPDAHHIQTKTGALLYYMFIHTSVATYTILRNTMFAQLFLYHRSLTDKRNQARNLCTVVHCTTGDRDGAIMRALLRAYSVGFPKSICKHNW